MSMQEQHEDFHRRVAEWMEKTGRVVVDGPTQRQEQKHVDQSNPDHR